MLFPKSYCLCRRRIQLRRAAGGALVSRVTNIFIELHEARFGGADRRFGSGWENLFTEQLAFFLASDLPAATALARTLVGGTDVTVEGVSTQVVATEGIPDLRLEFAGGTCLYVEHKFDAPLGPAQLDRYLAFGRVVLVSRCSQSVPADVLRNTDYLRPKDRDYFHWRDVYDALLRAEAAPEGFGGLREHFKGYMRELGLAPSALTSEWPRLFEERTEAENRAVQKDFGRLLDPVKAQLRSRGLRVQDVSHKGKQAYAPDGSLWRHLYVKPDRVRADFLEAVDCAPFEPGYEGLVVELVFDSSRVATVREAHEALRSDRRSLGEHNWYVTRPRAIGTDRLRLSLASPLVPYLRNGSGISPSLSESALWALELLSGAVAKVAGTGCITLRCSRRSAHQRKLSTTLRHQGRSN